MLKFDPRFFSRPDSTLMWFLQPLKSLAFMLWRNHKWLIIKLVLISLLAFVLALFIYSTPGNSFDRAATPSYIDTRTHTCKKSVSNFMHKMRPKILFPNSKKKTLSSIQFSRIRSYILHFPKLTSPEFAVTFYRGEAKLRTTCDTTQKLF